MPPTAFELPRVGSLFAEQFDLLERIGEGGMGVVYRAYQRKLRREVAVKVLRPDAVRRGYEQSRIEREAVSAARLRSRHVVQVFDWGIASCGSTYLVMELLQGETLAAALQRQPLRSPLAVAAWLRQCSEALDEASSFGIVHRDIKPSNLFLTDAVSGAEPTTLKVLDFGITKCITPAPPAETEPATQSGLRLGTTGYMSPEQLRSTCRVDARADIWSLGVVAYEALTGTLPFAGQCEAELIVSILCEAPRLEPLLAARSSAAVVAVVHRALEKDPARRYSTAGEFARAFALAAGDAVSAQSPLETAAEVERDAGAAASIGALRSGEGLSFETLASRDSAAAARSKRELPWRSLAAVGVVAAVGGAIVFGASRTPWPPHLASAPRSAMSTAPQGASSDANVEGLRLAALAASSSPRPATSREVDPRDRIPGPSASDFPKSVARPLARRPPAPSLVSEAPSPPRQEFERDNPYAN